MVYHEYFEILEVDFAIQAGRSEADEVGKLGDGARALHKPLGALPQGPRSPLQIFPGRHWVTKNGSAAGPIEDGPHRACAFHGQTRISVFT